MRYYDSPVRGFRETFRPLRHALYLAHKSVGGVSGIFDPHPRTEGQFRAQQSLAGVPWFGQWYSDYMRNVSLQERNKNTRDLYGLKFSDVKYPWLAGVYSDNVNGSVMCGSWQFSKNISRLYR